MNALQWILPISIMSGLSYVYFSRGRHLGRVERPPIDLFRGAGGASA
jgi:lipopolysaccharide export system permease protein